MYSPGARKGQVVKGIKCDQQQNPKSLPTFTYDLKFILIIKILVPRLCKAYKSIFVY